MKKRQTTLPAFDKKQIRRNLRKKNSNVFIAAKEANKPTPSKELSRLSDALLKDLKKLNIQLRKKKRPQFTITSATGNAEWELEPSFMLTNVPEDLMKKIHKLSAKYKQQSIAVSNKNETGASFVTPEGKIQDKYRTMVFDANAEYSTDFPTGDRLTFLKEEKKKYADITFKEMSEDAAVKVFQDDGYFGYEKRSMRYRQLSRDSIWATAPATMFVAFDGETPVAVCGIAKYKSVLLGAGIHTREGYKGKGLFGLCVQKVLSEKGSKTLYINVANEKLAELGSFRKRGFTDMKVEELPEEIREELKDTKYADQVQKWIKSNTGSWFDLVKARKNKIKMSNKKITKGMWKGLIKIIRDDKYLMGNKQKFVRYSNLGKVNKNMVDMYLNIGLKFPERRYKCLLGIQDEMLRSSTERYDVEDKSRVDK